MILSVVLVGPAGLGVAGALLGTTISLAVMLSFDPVLVYREVFHKGAAPFYRLYLRDMCLVAVTALAVKAVTLPFGAYTLGNFLVKMAACALIPNGLWYLLFRKSPQFAYLREKTADLWNRLIRRKAG